METAEHQAGRQAVTMDLADVTRPSDILTAMTMNDGQIAADLGKIWEALGLFASCIKSGEDWTGTCERVQSEANEAMKRISAIITNF